MTMPARAHREGSTSVRLALSAARGSRALSLARQIRADLASFPGGRSRSAGIVGMPNVGKVEAALDPACFSTSI